MDKRDAKAMADDSRTELEIKVDFKDTCIDFAMYALDKFEQSPCDTVEELWEEWRDQMTEKVFKLLNTDEFE